MLKRYRSRERGVALIFAIGLLSLLLVLGLAFVANALSAKKVSLNNSSRTQSKMFALSAANRAAASVMLYQMECNYDQNVTAFPNNFDNVYSSGKVNSPEIETNDGLVNKSNSESVMLLPEDDSVIASTTAAKFNDRLAADASKPWSGKWVYFFSGLGGSDMRIVGRAAWQAFFSTAQISAPVFFRGHLGETSGDSETAHAANLHRWGRDIYEVKLNNTAHFTTIPANYLGERIEDLRTYCENGFITLTRSTDKEKEKEKQWVGRWLTPDPGATISAVTDPAAWDPHATKIVPETYNYQAGETVQAQQLVRFNISDLYNAGVDEITEYKDANGTAIPGTADPWYARFGINSTSGEEEEKAKLNSEYVLTDLTRDSQIYESADEYDYDITAREERSGLPFLRRIGSNTDKHTFWKYTKGDSSLSYYDTVAYDVARLRKQIAANMNDYCDKDGVPTSDVKASEWTTSATEPTYTGNEKTPYLYELGAQIGFYQKDKDAAITCSFSGTDTGEKTGTFSFGMKIAPMVKLANLYPFDPSADPGCSNLKALLKFSDVRITFKLEEVVMHGIQYVNLLNTTKTIDSLTVSNIQSSPLDLCPDSLKDVTIIATVSGSALSDGSALIFSDAEVNNADGTHPYPFKYATDDAGFQSIDAVTMDTSADHTLKLQFSKTALLACLAADDKGTLYVKEIKAQPTSMDVKKIQITELSILPRQAVLTATVGGTADVGIDYAQQFKATSNFSGFKWAWSSGDTATYITTEGSDPAQGILFSLARCYDPRQNLNNADWYPYPATFDGSQQITNCNLTTAANYKAPTAAEINNVMAVTEVDSVIRGSYSADALFSPQNQSTGDTETATEPGYTATSHISTAFIRNAPMMSPWELGLIHRGIKWQTLNLKSSSQPDDTGTVPVLPSSYDANGTSWDKSGTTYAAGDAGLLDQIKMTQQCMTYGKINVNMFNVNDAGFKDSDFKQWDLDVFKALWDGIYYGEPITQFFANSKRTGGNFAGKSQGETPETAALTATQAALDKMAAVGNSVSLKTYPSQSADLRYTSRAQLVNFTNGTAKLANAFGLVENGETDAEQEELIGKTINLLTAETASPNQVQIVVVAQSIKDVAGVQYRPATDTVTSIGTLETLTPENGLIHKTCAYGTFDAALHASDDGKNVYFDEITGEVKMLVTLDRNPMTGKLSIRRIDYLD